MSVGARHDGDASAGGGSGYDGDWLQAVLTSRDAQAISAAPWGASPTADIAENVYGELRCCPALEPWSWG